MALDAVEIEKRVNDSYELPNTALGAVPAPVVTVRTYTYQHAPYIQDCIEGVLAQKTTFPFEYIIGEDCSADGTREIVFDYAQRYPHIIRVVTADYNVGGKANVRRCINRTRGKYVALCEGDDYWISPLKLQRQVDFMEAHPDVSLCFHNALILNEKYAAARLFFESPPAEILNFAAAYQTPLPTASMMARRHILASLPDWRLKAWCGDLPVRLWCAHHGHFGYLDQMMAVYRRHSGSLEAGMRAQNYKTYYDDVVCLYQEFDKATHFAHTDLVQREIARLKEEQLRQQLRRWYFLLRPRSIVVRLKEYANWIYRQKNLLG